MHRESISKLRTSFFCLVCIMHARSSSTSALFQPRRYYVESIEEAVREEETGLQIKAWNLIDRSSPIDAFWLRLRDLNLKCVSRFTHERGRERMIVSCDLITLIILLESTCPWKIVLGSGSAGSENDDRDESSRGLSTDAT